MSSGKRCKLVALCGPVAANGQIPEVYPNGKTFHGKKGLIVKTLATPKCVVVALSLALGTSSLMAKDSYFVYKVVDGQRDWNYTNGWFSSGNVAYGRLPAADDFIWLTGTDLAPATPLCVTNAVKSKALLIGRGAADDAALRIDENGSFTYNGSGGTDYRWGFRIGGVGRGTFICNGGSANFYANYGCFVGYAAGALGVVSNVAGNIRHGGITLGNVAGATGVVSLVGGSFHSTTWSEYDVRIGNAGVGLMDVCGGTYDGCNAVAAGNGGGKTVLYLGAGQGGDGTLLVRSGKIEGAFVHVGYASNSVGRVEVTGGTASAMRSFYVGVNGTGTMDVKSNFAEGELFIGGRGAGTGRVTVHEGVTNSTMKSTYNSGEVHVGGGSNADFGAGELLLKGGAMWVRGSSSFNIGVGESSGLVRGWGVVLPSDLNTRWTTTLTLKFGNGVVVADGGGRNRLLDFNDPYQLVRAVTNSVSGGTNGWYAVNGGCVHFPYVDHSYNATVERCLGDNRWSAEPDLVNSVWLSIKNTGGGAIHGGFYASDRTDCHLDELPAHDGIVGVWKLGETDSLSSTGCSNWHSWESGVPCTTLQSAKVKFRYDEAAVPERAMRLVLHRYESGMWKQVAEKRLEGGDDPTIATDFLRKIADDKVNIGTFALVAKTFKGTRIFVK